MSKPDNPAIWNGLLQSEYRGSEGYFTPLTLRDLFAAFALAGLNASDYSVSGLPSELADAAYRQAEAMLQERAK